MAAVITSLTPPSARVGDANFTLHVNGTGFLAGADVVFFGAGATTVVSPTELTVPVQASEVDQIGTFPVRVVQSDGQSNQVNFSVAQSVVDEDIALKSRHCISLCPPPVDCQLPAPWPPAPVPAP